MGTCYCFYSPRAPHETHVPQSNWGTVVPAHSPPHVTENSVFTWKPDLAVQTHHFQNEIPIFCCKYTPPVPPILINVCTHDVSELVIAELSLWREKQTINTSTNKQIIQCQCQLEMSALKKKGGKGRE